MSSFAQIIYTLPMLALTVLVEFRFLNKTLKRKYSIPATILSMLLVKCIAGYFNVQFFIAGTILTNTLYYSTLDFVFCIMFFRGSAMKILFLNAMMFTSAQAPFYMILPFCFSLFSSNAMHRQLALNALSWISLLIWTLFLEYAGRRFSHLRNELPSGYTALLIIMVLFVYIALYSTFDFHLLLGDGVLVPMQAIGCFLFALFGAFVIFHTVFDMDTHVGQCLAKQQYTLQSAHFRSREEEWRILARFRHDMKNHLLCLEGLLENGKSEQATAYMKTLTQTLSQIDIPVQTGNDYADAIVSAKLAQANALGIAMSVEMLVPAEGYIQPADLCCILSNALDNALAACIKIENKADAWISIRSFLRQEQLIIEIKNSIIKYAQEKEKPVESGHGYGLENVRTIVERYGGILDLSQKTYFTFCVLLPPAHS